MRKYGLIALVALLLVPAAVTAGPAGSAQNRKLQFIIVLRPVPRLLQVENWTDADTQVVDEHIAQLKQLLSEGKLILAGSTIPLDATKFGIAILEVDSAEEARRIMENDAGVKAKIFTAELFPYQVAMIRGQSPASRYP
jgi:uncharacterized protein YciI